MLMVWRSASQTRSVADERTLTSVIFHQLEEMNKQRQLCQFMFTHQDHILSLLAVNSLYAQFNSRNYDKEVDARLHAKLTSSP